MKHILFITISFIFFYSVASSADTYVVSGHSDYPPLVWQDQGEILGVGIDFLKEASKRLGIDFKQKLDGNWGKVLEMAEVGEVDAIPSAYKSASREEYLYYLPTATIIEQNVIIVPKDRQFYFKEWKDLDGKLGVTHYGESFGTEFDQFIDKIGIRRVESFYVALQLLLDGKVDYMPTGFYTAFIQIRRFAAEDKVKMLPIKDLAKGQFIAISKKSGLMKYKKQLNELMIELKRNGFIEKLFEKNTSYYLLANKAQASKKYKF